VRTHEGVVSLDEATRERILERGRSLGAQGMRTLGVASAEVGALERYGVEAEAELTFEGLLTFADPPKERAKETVTDLARLGVRVTMISGDAREVAVHVATQVGISTERVLTGKELATMRDEALWNVAPKTGVFAEVDPNQKERIILALRKSGHVVGYMGDGINDAPALHAADVSLSVDGAVDVAREAADFVLLEQDLGVLRDGVLEGRTTFANTMKYIYTTESANFGNMLSMAAAAAFLPFLPLLAIQVLLNNLLSDVPAIAIAGDAVDPELVERPQRWDLGALSRFMFSFGLISTFFDLLTFAVLYAVLGAREAEFRTGWFVESLLTELAVALVVRTRRAAWKSRPSAMLLGSSVAVAVIAVALPYTWLGAQFSLVPAPPAMMLVLATITVAYVAAVEAWKRVFFRRLAAG
jgi:Mg2+-importing ATPase